MNRNANSLLWARMFWGVAIVATFTPVSAGDPLPLVTAHAHNDYRHDRPLADALAQGFCSVEADVFVSDGRLLVGHDRRDLRPDRTLRRLYLDPLREQVAEHGGRVFPGGPTFTLLIDFKSAALPTYAVLTDILKTYNSMLVRTVSGQQHEGAVQIIISGNRPTSAVTAAHASGVCRTAIDGRLSDLADSSPRLWLPLISDRWTSHFRWNGEGEISADEAEKLDQIVRKTHAQGRRLRFWATPDRPEAWRRLSAAHVDLINTDDLSGLAAFLRAQNGVSTD